MATDARDVRPWYSLGQAYEMMGMPYYALFYYRKAAQLTPDDARMWVRSLGSLLHAGCWHSTYCRVGGLRGMSGSDS